MTRKNSKQIIQPPIEKSKMTDRAKEANEDDNFELPVLRRSNRRSSKNSQNREMNKVNDAIVVPSIDDIEEPSMYEDAVGRPVPIMNSTLKYSLCMSEKRLNATVILERLPKLNETVVIQKAMNIKNSSSLKETKNTKNALPNNTQPCKTPAQYDDYNVLITDDESSPEVKKPRKQLNRKQTNKKGTKGMLAISSEDEIPNTPVKTVKNTNVSTVTQESKTYKSNALFSPYAKESVKKRVEAFEQAVMHSPKSVDIDAPTRITRTKTRAMATAEMQAETKTTERNVAQILARKSLAKAKKISLAKQKNNDEFKEVKESVIIYAL